MYFLLTFVGIELKGATMKAKKDCTPEEYKAQRYAQRRQWALDNIEKVREYGRAFYKRNSEKRRAYSRKYNEEHRAERRAYSKAYYERKKTEDPLYIRKLNERNKKNRRLKNPVSLVPAVMGTTALTIKKPFRKRKILTEAERYEGLVRACKKTLNEYLYRSLERDKERNSSRIDDYFTKFPYELYGERAIKKRLGWFGIHKNKAMYDDCFDAGVMAYMYSIHRCGASGYDYFLPYLYKMIRIYILCALIIYNDSRNICKINGFNEINISKEENTQRY